MEILLDVKKNNIFKLVIYLFFIYASVYGTLSIFLDNVIIRSLKDGVLSLLVFLGCISIVFGKASKTSIILLGSLISFTLIAILSGFNKGTILLFLYGFKITILPMLSLFVGIYLKRKNIQFEKPLFIIYFIIVSAWLLQYILGIDKLLQMGFEYGHNVSHYVNGQLRLPSMNGAPDSYAFLLAITGILIEIYLISSLRRKTALFFKILTFILLALTTIRSPLLLWLIFQGIQYLRSISIKNKQSAYMGISLLSFAIALSPILIQYVVAGSSLTDTSSLKMRFLRWGIHLPSLNEIEGIIGFGLGTLGAASQRAYDLGYQTLDWATDNQYIAVYGQTGLLGFLCFASFLIIVLLTLRENIKSTSNSLHLKAAQSLLIATLISGLFTNNLEIYPFNIILWTYIGLQIPNLYVNKD